MQCIRRLGDTKSTVATGFDSSSVQSSPTVKPGCHPSSKNGLSVSFLHLPDMQQAKAVLNKIHLRHAPKNDQSKGVMKTQYEKVFGSSSVKSSPTIKPGCHPSTRLRSNDASSHCFIPHAYKSKSKTSSLRTIASAHVLSSGRVAKQTSKAAWKHFKRRRNKKNWLLVRKTTQSRVFAVFCRQH